MNYRIIRPPLSAKFEVPSREDLLKLKIGDLVKIMFQVDDEPTERMWVIITEQQDIAEWTGTLDNEPVGEKTKKVLKPGMVIKFHPYDVVQEEYRS